MADKRKPAETGSGASDAVEAVRSAVERTFQATAVGAAGTGRRTRQIVDELAAAAARIRAGVEDRQLLEEVRGLRAEIESLGRRVASLERRQADSSSRRPP